MIKHYLKRSAFFATLFVCLHSHAQVNEVLRASQFGGITNVSFNPAIADNPFLVDINLISVGAGVSNNYLGVNSKALTDHSLFNDPNFQTDQVKERLNGDYKSAFVGMSVQGPLSFMVSFGKKHSNKNAIGVSWHNNMVFNIDNVSQEFARIAYYGIGTRADSITQFNYQSLNNQNFGAKLLAWSDFGITYSRVLYDEGAHMLKVGATGKFLVGWAGMYISSKNINYKFRNYDTLDIYNSDISYGHSQAITEQQNVTLNSILSNKSKTSFGADLGVVYEWRPDKDKYQYEADCQKWYRNDLNKYKLAAGFSVIDIGRVAFAKPGDVSSYTANIVGWDVKQEPITNVATFDSVLHSKPANFTSIGGNSFKMWLPTRFNLFVDYEIYRGIGLNLTGIISPNLAHDNNQVHYPTSITLTPRYDMKWIGVYIPLTYDQYGNFGAGAGLRAGPFFVTSSNLITMFADKFVFAANIQAGVKITIPYMKQKDKNKNHKLGNDVIDSICPSYTADLYKYFPKKSKMDYGTPTPDKVGAGTYVITRPNAKGGCPDSGVVTIAYLPGVNAGGNKTINVCGGTTYDLTASYPNTGYSSYTWNTPTPEAVPSGTYTLVVAGAGGCTDTARATISANPRPNLGGNKRDSIFPGSTYDLNDLYPKFGYVTYTWAGVSNFAAVPAGNYQLIVVDKNGCSDTATATITQKTPPPLTKKELATIKYAFDNLEFETNKDVIKLKSYPAMNSLATLLVDKGYGLKIEGHTDNVGNAEYNMALSLKRAEAVKTYLIGKGVTGTKLETEGFGLTKPIADNKTAEGRKKNRRVEMTVLYK